MNAYVPPTTLMLFRPTSSRLDEGMELSAVKRPAFSSKPSISLLVISVPVNDSGSRRESSYVSTGIIGIYGPNPIAETKAEQEGTFPVDFGKAWIKSPHIIGGQAPIMRYNRQLMMSILWDRMPYLTEMVNPRVISLDEAPQAYAEFDQGSLEKFVIDPHGMIAR